jgi:ribonuclease P protein component
MSEFGLDKSEKLCHRSAVDALFAGGVSSVAYPLRMVCRVSDRNYGSDVQFLITIPKKRIRKAVGRVLMRRRIREAYRLNRSFIGNLGGKKVDIAFLYISNELSDYSRVERKMQKLLSSLTVILDKKDETL